VAGVRATVATEVVVVEERAAPAAGRDLADLADLADRPAMVAAGRDLVVAGRDLADRRATAGPAAAGPATAATAAVVPEVTATRGPGEGESPADRFVSVACRTGRPLRVGE
jgi:hypothetical protein